MSFLDGASPAPGTASPAKEALHGAAPGAEKNLPLASLGMSVFSWEGWGPGSWLLRMRAMMLGWKDRTGLAVGAWGGTLTSGQTSPERLQDPGCSPERRPRACLNQGKGVAATATCAGQAWFEEDPVPGETHTYVRAVPRLETQVRTVAVSRQQCQNLAPTPFHRR